MSDPNERSEETQQEAGSIQDDTEVTVEVTEAAERKAQELGVDLARVEGTGPGGRITAADVEDAHRQTDSTAGPVETHQIGGSVLPPTPPTREDIQRQYVALKATLAGPRDGTAPLRIIKEDGVEELITAGTFPDNPTNFFAPEPIPAEQPPDKVPVTWILPRPQRPLPKRLPGTSQRCRREECLPDNDGPIE
jgi:pyruvate/2-oxoglutarate dehydrogenase complex dihydrolipoamide acyltransferase (E2) component